MKYHFVRPPSKRSLAVAGTYLAVIMTLSAGFSIAFYWTSTNALKPAQMTPTHERNTGPVSTQQWRTNSVDTLTVAPFQNQVAEIRSRLLRRLITFNVGIAVVGACVSYALARRTLRPMEDALATQERFAADASHELRTPVATMLAEIDITTRDSNATPKRLRAALASCREELVNLQNLSERLLQLAQPGKPDATIKPISLDQAIQTAINRFRKLARDRQITIAGTTPGLSGRVDMADLVLVLAILLDNAIKYSPTGSTITIDGHADKRYAYLHVRDQGIGIGQEDLLHIFDRFYRADTSRSNHRVNGYGLGLSLAQTIMWQQQGGISAKSKLGVGSEFIVKIPA